MNPFPTKMSVEDLEKKGGSKFVRLITNNDGDPVLFNHFMSVIMYHEGQTNVLSYSLMTESALLEPSTVLTLRDVKILYDCDSEMEAFIIDHNVYYFQLTGSEYYRHFVRQGIIYYEKSYLINFYQKGQLEYKSFAKHPESKKELRGIVKAGGDNFFVVMKGGYVYVDVQEFMTSFVKEVTLTDGIEHVHFDGDDFLGLIKGKYKNVQLRFIDGKAIARL